MKRSIFKTVNLCFLLLLFFTSCKKNNELTEIHVQDAQKAFEKDFTNLYHRRDYLGRIDWVNYEYVSTKRGDAYIFHFLSDNTKVDAYFYYLTNNGQAVESFVRMATSQLSYGDVISRVKNTPDSLIQMYFPGSPNPSSFVKMNRSGMLMSIDQGGLKNGISALEGGLPATCMQCHNGTGIQLDDVTITAPMIWDTWVPGRDPWPGPNPGTVIIVPTATREINNNVTDPCLRATISDALSSNKNVKGFISELIDKYSGKNKSTQINIYNEDIGGPARTSPRFDQNGKFIADITLNHNYFKDTSKELVVANLIHEAVHAYLYQTNSNYRTLPRTAQHNFLFQNFVKDIAQYMTNKYGMNATDAFSLAWAGMGEVYEDAPSDTEFPIGDGKSITKFDISGAIAPYGYVGEGSKGSPNCPK